MDVCGMADAGGCRFTDRLYTDGFGTMNVIDLDGNFVHWGLNGDAIDTGLEFDNGRQQKAVCFRTGDIPPDFVLFVAVI